jgi:hypothetical protein
MSNLLNPWGLLPYPLIRENRYLKQSDDVADLEQRHSRTRNFKKTFLSILVLAVTLVLVAGVETVGVHSVFTSRMTGASDLFPRWVGAKMMFFEGANPYSSDVTQVVQRGLYNGRLARDGEDQVAFAYPIYSAYFIVPLIFLDYPWAQAVWMVGLQFAVVAGVLLGMDVFSWRAPPWLLGVTCVWAVLFYNSGQAILLGQYSVIVFLLIALMLWCLRSNHDFLAGVFLAFSTVKPQMVFLLIPSVVIWALLKRRWSVPVNFGVTLLCLAASGLLLAPTWIADYIAGMLNYAEYTAYGSPVWLLTEHYFPFLGRPVNILLTLSLLTYWLRIWSRAASWTWEDFGWATGLTLVLTNLIALRTATANYTVLLLPLLFVFRQLSSQVVLGNLYVIIVEIVSVFGFWILFAATVVTDRGVNLSFEDPIMFMPLPVILFIVFALTRDRLTSFGTSDILGELRS